jgi:transposase InsO family protein
VCSRPLTANISWHRTPRRASTFALVAVGAVRINDHYKIDLNDRHRGRSNSPPRPRPSKPWPRPRARCRHYSPASSCRTRQPIYPHGAVGYRSRRRRQLAPAPHEDLVSRRFVADRPDRLWCTDITEHHTAEGTVYCAAVLDVFSRQVVGWSIADHMRSELVVDALEMACWRRRPTPGAIVHSDRGANTPAGSSVTDYAPPACSARWAGSPARWTTL